MVFTPGDACDVLVAMNAAALKVNLKSLKKGGKIIANTDGFDSKNLRLANFPEGVNPLDDGSLGNYEVIKMDITKMTREALKEIILAPKKRIVPRTCLYWVSCIGCTIVTWRAPTISEIQIGKKPEIFESNMKALQAGYNYGDTTETFTTTYGVEKPNASRRVQVNYG